jgi:phosphate uptake regulator
VVCGTDLPADAFSDVELMNNIEKLRVGAKTAVDSTLDSFDSVTIKPQREVERLIAELHNLYRGIIRLYKDRCARENRVPTVDECAAEYNNDYVKADMLKRLFDIV